jgi:hypothetical protein
MLIIGRLVDGFLNIGKIDYIYVLQGYWKFAIASRKLRTYKKNMKNK